MLVGGISKFKEVFNFCEDWVSIRFWNDIFIIGVLLKFVLFFEEFKNYVDGFKKIFDSLELYREELLGKWNIDLDFF